jgi:TRAP transporter TAXI family solute receptor
MKALSLRERSLDALSRHPWLVLIVAIALVIGLLSLATRTLRPAPPQRFVLATGAPGGAYFAFGERYRALLAREGITLELRPTSGSAENLARLLDDASGVDAAFVQGGIIPSSNQAADRGADSPGTAQAPAPPAIDERLVSLGALYYEPLWIFHRKARPVTRLDQLTGLRLAIGAAGSGTRVVALDLLSQSGVTEANAHLEGLSTIDAADALIEGKVDALFMIAGEDSRVVRRLLTSPGISLASLDQATGTTRRRPYLSTITLPEGVIDFNRDIPPRDVTLLATTANLVVRADLHPALMYLLLDAASTLHRGHSAFNEAGSFPSARHQDVALAPQAERYYQVGKPLLQRYLPFWVAIFVDRIWVFLLPLFAILLPLTSVLPRLIGLPTRLRLQRAYRLLARIEREVLAGPSSETVRQSLAALDALEQQLGSARFPADQLKEAYALRLSIDLVRERLASPGAKVLAPLRP